MDNKLISIIVPIYKVELYLSKCIESIMNQTYRNLEIILVDDGSPDECGKICDSYATMDSRIKVIHQRNAGVSAARNVGLSVAQGEYIGFVDPDDWVDPQMYESMLKALSESDAELAICGYNYYFESGEKDSQREYPVRDNEIISQKEILNRLADMPPTIRCVNWNKLFKKDTIGNQCFQAGLHSSEDLLFLGEYILKMKSAVVVHKPLYSNLIREGSATHGGLSIVNLTDSFMAHDKMYRDTISLYPELKNHALAFLLDVCMLKYNEAKRQLDSVSIDERSRLEKRINYMHNYIRKRAFSALFNPEIYWKTRIMYVIKR